MAKAENCNDKCSNYDYCVEEGNTSRFLPGAVCSDFFAKEDDTEE